MIHAASGHALTGLFAALAIGALLSTRHDDDLRFVGIMLIVNLAISNIVIYATHDPQARAGVFTLAEIMVAVTAYVAFAVGPDRRLLIAVVAVCVLSGCATVAYAMLASPSRGQVNFWHLITNGCFATNCLLTAATGRLDAVGVDRFWPWGSGARRPVEPHVVDG